MKTSKDLANPQTHRARHFRQPFRTDHQQCNHGDEDNFPETDIEHGLRVALCDWPVS